MQNMGSIFECGVNGELQPPVVRSFDTSSGLAATPETEE